MHKLLTLTRDKLLRLGLPLPATPGSELGLTSGLRWDSLEHKPYQWDARYATLGCWLSLQGNSGG